MKKLIGFNDPCQSDSASSRIYLQSTKTGIYGGPIRNTVFLIADGVLFYELICGRKKEEIQKEIEEVSYLQEIECIRHEMFAEKEQELLHLKQIFDDQLENIRKRIANGEVEAAKVEMDHFQKSLDETRPEEYCQNRVVNAVMSEKRSSAERKILNWMQNLWFLRHFEWMHFKFAACFKFNG